MVSAVYVSGKDIETLFPLLKREKPVPNLTVLGKPVAVWVAQAILGAGIEDAIMTYHSIAPNVRGTIGEKISLLECGEESAVNCAIEAVSQTKSNDIALIIGSHIFGGDFLRSSIAGWNEVGGKSLAVLVPDQLSLEERAGRIGVDVEFIGKYVKNASIIGEKDMPYLFTGTILGEREEILDMLKSPGNIREKIVEFLKRTRPSFYIYSGRHSSITSPWALLELVKSLLTDTAGVYISSTAKVSPTAVIEGSVVIEDGATIDHYSVIKGPVYISRGAFVGAHTLLRSGVSVEPFAVIGAGVELKRSYVGYGATIGSHCNVTDSVLGERSTMRPMVVTLNFEVHEAKKRGEAYRKKGSIIGEGAIVNGGTTLKPGSVVEPGQIYP